MGYFSNFERCETRCRPTQVGLIPTNVPTNVSGILADRSGRVKNVGPLNHRFYWILRTAANNCEQMLAEGVGFEPTLRFPVNTLSKRAPSATRPPLRIGPASQVHISSLHQNATRAFARQPTFLTRQRPSGGGNIATVGPPTTRPIWRTRPPDKHNCVLSSKIDPFGDRCAR